MVPTVSISNSCKHLTDLSCCLTVIPTHHWNLGERNGEDGEKSTGCAVQRKCIVESPWSQPLWPMLWVHYAFVFSIMFILQIWSYFVFLSWWHTWNKDHIGGKKKTTFTQEGNSLNTWLHNLWLLCIAAEAAWIRRLTWGKKCSASFVAESVAAFCQCKDRSSVISGGKAISLYPSSLTTGFWWSGGGDTTGLYSSFVTVL